MAKSGQERSAKAAEKRSQYDEKELRHRCRLGTRQTLETLMAWNADTEQASVIEGCLRYVHSLGPEGAREALKLRHEIVISENVAREFRNQSMAELKRDPGDEIIPPDQNLEGAGGFEPPRHCSDTSATRQTLRNLENRSLPAPPRPIQMLL
jgi:hypothetical protein